MRTVELDTERPKDMTLERWIGEQLSKVNEASREDPMAFCADAIQIVNPNELRTLDCDTATLDDVRKVLGTLIRYMQQRGPLRRQ